MSNPPLLVKLDDLETYSPPLHSGTVNRRLVEASLGAGMEVVHGTIEPGGAGHRHQHDKEWQMILWLELGDAAPEIITAGTVVRIPPRTPHLFEVTGNAPAKVLVIYSPPLGENGFVPA